jgi:hypothetical protein
MTKKRIGTKKRSVKKQMKRKSMKMRKNMKGGNRAFVKKIARCIPQDEENYSDIPISVSGYQNKNDDDWTKLAENISHNGPIQFECDGKNALIYGDNSIHVDFNNNIKRGKLYGIIGNSCPIILWCNGIQQTYEPPSSNIPPPPVIESRPVTPPRTTPANLPPLPPPINRINRINTNQRIYQQDIPTSNLRVDGVSIFGNDIPGHRAYTGYNNLRNPTRYSRPKPPRTQ